MDANGTRRLVPYRDVDGYVIEIGDNAAIEYPFVTAHYVRCPETDGLRTLHACDECPMNDGRSATDEGQYCKSKKEYTDAPCYNQKTVQALLVTRKPKTKIK